MSTDPNRYPPGLDAATAKAIIDHYENQTEDEAVAEDEAAMAGPGQTLMPVPDDLVPIVRDLIAKHRMAG